MGKLLKVFLSLRIVLTFTLFSYRHVHPKIPLLFPLAYPFCLTSRPLSDAHDEFTHHRKQLSCQF